MTRRRSYVDAVQVVRFPNGVFLNAEYVHKDGGGVVWAIYVQVVYAYSGIPSEVGIWCDNVASEVMVEAATVIDQYVGPDGIHRELYTGPELAQRCRDQLRARFSRHG